jgi:pyrroline-5-carboxylate reductase
MLGCGNMGGALLKRWLNTGLDGTRVSVIDPAPRRIDGVAWLAELPAGKPDLFILGVKPQMLGDIASAVSAHVGRDTVLLSMLAGIDCAALRSAFPHAGCIVRIMPNMPVVLGKGVTGLFSDEGQREDVDGLMADTGLSVWLDREDMFHALTAVSGSGPAFVYRFIGAIAAAGVGLGLSKDQSLQLARAMTEGAAALCGDTGEDPAELARQVTSLGGTTAEGLAALDRDGLFSLLVQETLTATARRSRELGEVNVQPPRS